MLLTHLDLLDCIESYLTEELLSVTKPSTCAQSGGCKGTFFPRKAHIDLLFTYRGEEDKFSLHTYLDAAAPHSSFRIFYFN